LLERDDAAGSLHFYMANLSGLRRALFPSLQQAYEAWLAHRDGAPLCELARRGETHWLDAARHLMDTAHGDPAQADARLHALATGDLATLRL